MKVVLKERTTQIVVDEVFFEREDKAYLFAEYQARRMGMANSPNGDNMFIGERYAINVI